MSQNSKSLRFNIFLLFLNDNNLLIKLLPRNLCKATVKIMAACSFKAIVGGPCSYDRRDQSKSVNEVLLLSCVKRHRKAQVALVLYQGNWRARTHSSKSGYFYDATGCQRSNDLSLSSL